MLPLRSPADSHQRQSGLQRCMVSKPAGTKWHHFTPSEQPCLSCSSCEVRLQGASYEDPESGFMTFCISFSVPSQNLKTSYGVEINSICKYSKKYKCFSVFGGGLLNTATGVRRCASYSACRFVHALCFFFSAGSNFK